MIYLLAGIGAWAIALAVSVYFAGRALSRESTFPQRMSGTRSTLAARPRRPRGSDHGGLLLAAGVLLLAAGCEPYVDGGIDVGIRKDKSSGTNTVRTVDVGIKLDGKAGIE